MAIGAMFFVNGATFASWSPRLPEVQADLGISDAALGLTLLGMSLGGLASSALSGRLVDRRGSRASTVATSAAMSIWLPLVGLAPSAALVFAALLVLGALDGLTDVAMNAQAIELQRRSHRSIMTRFHAVWSLGAVAGGIVASRAAAFGVSVGLQLAVTGALLSSATIVFARWLLPFRPAPTAGTGATDAGSSGRPMRTARPVLVRLFLVGTAIALCELPPNDWAALLVEDRFDVGPGRAGLGFVAVAGGMLVGRVLGDRVADRLGPERTRCGGAALGGLGVLLATTLPTPALAGAGLFVTGLGLSTLFPLVFRAASELTHGSHSGMAAFSAGARAGFLLASPLMGILGGATSVAVAMLLVAGTASVVVLAARLPRPAATPITYVR